jgi:membrane-associated HD superfamily phosphohydrolase
MKNFIISEEEKNRILGMHQEATKRHYLKEQLQPTTAANVAQPTIKYTEVAGSASAAPIKSAGVLTKLGVPATPENFNNTFFYTDRRGLAFAFANNTMSSFAGKSSRTTKSPDNVVALYNDDSQIKLEGEGTQEFLTKNLKYIGGAGNGLLALSRAIKSKNVLPSVIKITLSGERTATSYTYDSAKINDTTSTFNTLLPYFIKPLVNKTKVSSTYPFRDIMLDLPLTHPSIENLINSLFDKFLPIPQGKKIMDVAAEYGLDMDVDNFKTQILASSDLSNANTKWNQIQDAIINKYKENLTKFLKSKFPTDWNQKITSFNPSKSTSSAEQEIKKASGQYLPGFALPKSSATEKQTQQTFKSGQG